jgi:hypothetical protein
MPGPSSLLASYELGAAEDAILTYRARAGARGALLLVEPRSFLAARWATKPLGAMAGGEVSAAGNAGSDKHLGLFFTKERLSYSGPSPTGIVGEYLRMLPSLTATVAPAHSHRGAACGVAG